MGYIKDSWIKNAAARKEMLEYQRWFDACHSLKDCVSNGFIDFYHKIFTEDFYEIIGNPKSKTCLEIGFGGGRIINAASKLFNMAYGVDILDQKSINQTYEFLKQESTHNVTLTHRDKISLIKDKSIDFVYSYIVFQHFEDWNEADFYIRFIERVLSPKGAGIIFFGRSDNKDINIVTKDKFIDRGCSLYVSEKFATEYMRHKFDVIEVGSTTKAPWDSRKSGQFYIKFKHKG